MAAHIEEMRSRVHLDIHTVNNTDETRYPNTYAGYDDSWNLNKFKENFKVKIVEKRDNEVEFDMIGIDVPLANAYRRILLAEVPTMAIEEVFIYNNTTVIQDEVLSHRLGLLPIKVDPRLFVYKKEDSFNAKNTLQFRLKIKCKKNKKASSDTTNPDELYINSKVYTRNIEWEPLGDQKDWLPGGVRFTDEDILISMMRPGQEMDIMLHAVKGIGSDHAKFSPVATASYRLMPEIKILQPITGEKARKFQQCFSPGVIDLKKRTDGEVEAVVVCARKDTGSREVLRHSEFDGCVKLFKIKDHYIFSIESTGALDPLDLMKEAVKVLKDKCTIYKKELAVITS